MIYIQTTAYNASKTLRRTIESVLNQTYGEFQYYLTENGSVDRGATRKIVEEYAKQDNRIQAFFNEKNHVWDKNQEAILLPHHIGAEDYYCLLDADDEYLPTFFEDMLEFMDRNQLDIAACGNDFIHAKDNQLLGQRILLQDLILQGNMFEVYFPFYYQFMRPIWGKLFKGKTLVNTILDVQSSEIPKAYGNDTFFTIYAFREAKRAGILAKSLHRYYMSPQSTSFLFNPERTKSDRILRKAAFDYLKCYGPIQPKNKDFLDCVHANATKDSLETILCSNLSALEKLKWIKELFSDEGIKEIVQSSSPEVIEVAGQIRQRTFDWILMQKACGSAKGAEMSADIFSLLLSDCDMLHLLLEIRIKRPDFIAKLKKQKWAEVHIFRQPLLKDVSIDLAFALPAVIQNIMQENYTGAWETFLSNNELEIDDKDEEAYYLLGQNLAASVMAAEGYIYFKQKWISYLIDHMRLEEAETELNEFADIVPDNEEFERLRVCCKRKLKTNLT